MTVGTTGIGAAIGASLSEYGARRARSEEREQQRLARVHQRQDEAVAVLDEALLKIDSLLPILVAGEEASDLYWRARMIWQEAAVRANIVDEGVLDRYASIGALLLWSSDDVARQRGLRRTYVGRALRSARAGIAAFRREEPLPSPTFPPGRDLSGLIQLGPQTDDYSALDSWLDANPE